MADQFLGEIRMVGFNFATTGWLFCDGSVIPISQYNALYNLIGTSFGGDGETTFGLPDLRGRIPMHNGNNFAFAENAGSETYTLSPNEVPAHSHDVMVSSHEATTKDPLNNVPALWGGGQFSSQPPATPMSGLSIGASIGANEAHENMPPFQVINFIISTTGDAP